MSEPKRSYRSALRAEQAQRTRQAVVTAAAACFEREGYTRTTMKQIAAEAGVALQTVFAQGSKSALLLAAVDRAVVGDDVEQPMAERDWFQEVLTTRDRTAKLALLHAATLTFTPPSTPMLRVFREAAGGDADVAAAWAEYERRRYQDMRVLVGSFAHLLREDYDVDRATDVVWSVVTAATSDMFRLGRGWSLEQYADWLVDAVDRLLLR